MGQRRILRGFYAAAATAVLGLAIAISGCDSGDDSNGGADGGYGVPDDTDTGQVAEVTLTVAETALGPVLADANGMTLYLFTEDGEGQSTCYDDCAASWPPLTVEDEAAADEGVDETLLGTTERTDGTLQVTYNGHPLYYWANDAAPGDITGQGVNDVWYVVDPSGEAVTET